MQSGNMLLSEKLLSSAGGWQAMKTARELLRAGRVNEASYAPPLLSGQVRDGKTYRAGLRISSPNEIENLCTCRDSRQWGKICAHSLAVGLAVLENERAATPVAEPATPQSKQDEFFPENEPGTTALQLRLILPPNFSAAWTKGAIMICVEAEWSGGRAMRDALPLTLRPVLDERDRQIAEQLPSGMNTLDRRAFLQLLPLLRGHECVSFGRSTPARIDEGIYRPRFRIEGRGENDLRLSAQLQPNEKMLVAGQSAWLLRDGEFFEIGEGLPARLTNALNEPITLSGMAALQFLALELPLWREVAEGDLPPEIPQPEVQLAEPGFSLQLEGSLQVLRAKLRCRYGDEPAFSPVAEPGNQFVRRDPEKPERLLVRNLPAEEAALARLARSGFVEGEIRDPARVARFFAFDFAQLPNEWEISVAPQLEKTRNALEPLAPTIEVIGSGEDWFELRYSVASASGESIPLPEVQRLLRSAGRPLRLKNGRQAVLNPEALEDFEQLLRDVDPRQRQPGVYRLDKMHAGYLTNTAAEIGARLLDAQRCLTNPQQPVLPPGALGEQLRDYQRAGVAWLAALAAQKLGGILADEMGLGKTVQTLAFLQLRRGHGPALIVCPASLLVNWQREAARFTPELRLLAIEGTNRAEKIARLGEFDLGLTSYGLLRRDAELYRAQLFDSIVLDEAQHIKNPETQNAQAAFNLRSRQRFVLTGTPVENSVRDLWSLLHFVAPGYLGSRAEFSERYEKPLAREAEPGLQRRLARRVRPFLLRRRKADVARELPAKIEQVVPCDLGSAQRAAYDALLREIQSGLSAAPDDPPNNGGRRMKMLVALLRLRQTCCDLRLLDLPPNESNQSAKLDLLDELLAEIIDGGHRVLIFSQFVQMLDLIRERLRANETPHCYLAGLTRNRQEEADRFQNDPAIPVFLISLKAGGVGLNLAAADTVIHFDPWWNAAVEAQATDRAHRIGQRRVVTSYKLIARGTVEEKILRLQERKRELAGAMVENEAPLMTGLTTNELEALLES